MVLQQIFFPADLLFQRLVLLLSLVLVECLSLLKVRLFVIFCLAVEEVVVRLLLVLTFNVLDSLVLHLF